MIPLFETWQKTIKRHIGNKNKNNNKLANKNLKISHKQGFGSRRSFNDAVFIITQIAEKITEYMD